MQHSAIALYLVSIFTGVTMACVPGTWGCDGIYVQKCSSQASWVTVNKCSFPQVCTMLDDGTAGCDNPS
ncbi:hypothetical protein PGQ11_009892 [Apiospora arundinis]|uniref:Uncharacterized protein n=1 Tax=Apiospora arundinis TaxID=335852 RepID=A0ABR2I7Y1_9PEZI